MLKKAGIVVATAAAGLLAVSPLAFAGSAPCCGDGKQVNKIDTTRTATQIGLVNVGDVNALNNVNVCPPVNVAVGVLGLLAPAATATGGGTNACVNDTSTNQSNTDG